MVKRAKQSEGEREGNEDILSNLHDSLIFHILSFVNCTDVVRTCVLSKRWKNLWNHLPTVVIHSSSYSPSEKLCFKNFVSKLLLHRDRGSTPLHTLDFKHHGVYVDPQLLETVTSYAISHKVQQLRLYADACIDQLSPSIFLSIFSCQTLTFLKLSVYDVNHSWGVESPKSLNERIIFPKSLKLPSLTSLYLVNIAFCAHGDDEAEPFSTLNRLNNLVINYCTCISTDKKNTLYISSNTLFSLTIRSRDSSIKEIVLSTPNLCAFAFEGVPYLSLSGSSLFSLKQVYIDAYILRCFSEPPVVLLDWLKDLANVQSLTITMNTLKVLSLIPDLLKIKLSWLGNLESLKVKVKPISFTSAMSHATAISDGILDFLLQNSPSAKVSITKCQRYNVDSTL